MRHNIQTQRKIRVRIAPSPTGPFHVGTARTALFNYLFARKNNGAFVLRIEDTDKARSKKCFEKDIFESLEWLGLKPDESPVNGGPYGPYRQSERTLTYQEYIQKLLEQGKAFYCFTKKESKKSYRVFWSPDRDLSLKEAYAKIKAGEEYVIRFKTPRNKNIVFDDIIRGKLEFNTNTIGDFAIAKSEKEPLYNLAVVVDDWQMKISHIIRGEDHISNTPKQILIQDALGAGRPFLYAHLPLILGPDKAKLSKRHNPVALQQYRQEGYLPEAMVNFMALLGWNPGTEQEIFSLKDLISQFSLERVQLSGAVFNIKKLNWLNAYYLRKIPFSRLVELAQPYFQKDFFSLKSSRQILEVCRERLKKISDLPECAQPFLGVANYSPSLLSWKDMDKNEIRQSLEISLHFFKEAKSSNFQEESLKNALLSKAREFFPEDRGRLLWPLRVALTGLEKSPSPFEVAAVLGKSETIRRIQKALQKIS